MADLKYWKSVDSNGKINKDMCNEAGFEENFIYHPGKRTCATTLYQAGIDRKSQFCHPYVQETFRSPVQTWNRVEHWNTPRLDIARKKTQEEEENDSVINKGPNRHHTETSPRKKLAQPPSSRVDQSAQQCDIQISHM